MKAKPKGRPKKSGGERKQNVLRIRLTQDERDMLDTAAKGKTLETSTWARMVLLELAKSK